MDDGGDEDPANVHMANPTGHEDRNSAERERSALPTSPGADSEATTAAASPAPAPAARAASSTTSDGADRSTEKCSAGNVEDANGDEDDGRMAVRILDVRGQFYPLRVRPETTVGELKLMLVDATGVELVRQRIIHGGKVRAVFGVRCAGGMYDVPHTTDDAMHVKCNQSVLSFLCSLSACLLCSGQQ